MIVDDHVLYPRCFVGTREPGDLIIMEDLTGRGFKSANRMVGLDPDHTRLTIEKLASLHAASAVFIDKVRFTHLRGMGDMGNPSCYLVPFVTV